ncbi:DUF2167 domain-containing protein [Magnetospirillum sulfuroxidans]|uniref:DUF2167 domain-containing protein n=1 Tax=Magnetospirillum sulfuroxidans TaxID=611300 RepID=A0ABS5I6S2_9PROT|nr:DUF2167 domain-containing protein [Magnetospirillum sulfuroxidans]MBR9970117.1 DUF2167 domain-containing protein [Magnetospirillum sulfuroxidans]
MMIKRMLTVMVALVLVVSTTHAVRAQQDAADILRTLQFQSGTISLGANLAQLKLNDNFRFLNNADTQTFLTRIWGNPPGAGRNALGMIVPVDMSSSDDSNWAALVSYDPSGYVSDEEAGKIDYDELMADMKKAVAEASKERVQHGHEKLELLGWAKKPFYDAKEKKMYWAKRLRFGDAAEEALNYEIRILGRKGVLDLNVVASMNSLPSIDQRVGAILSMVEFNKGNTYAEFNPSVDQAAAYGLAGLVAGGVLTKAGFFKGLIALLFASKKLLGLTLIGGGAAIWGAFKALFRRKSPPAASSNE